MIQAFFVFYTGCGLIGKSPALGAGHHVGSSPAIPTIREVTKVLSTGALDASVSRFDSYLFDKKFNHIRLNKTTDESYLQRVENERWAHDRRINEWFDSIPRRFQEYGIKILIAV
jgi:hypothetical protein